VSTAAVPSRMSALRLFWPTLFKLAAKQVTVGPDYLIQEMRVTNTGDDDFTFTAALHTYYRVKNIDKVCSRSYTAGAAFSTVACLSNLRHEFHDHDVQTFLTGHMALRCPQVHIEGLKGAEYLDSLDSRKRKAEDGDVLQFNGEVDRIYTSVPGNLQARSLFWPWLAVRPICTLGPHTQQCQLRGITEGS